MTTTQQALTAEPLWFLDNLAYIHISGEQSGGAFSLIELSGARENMPPLHVHHRDDETFYVLDGHLRMFVGDRELMVVPGHSVLAPREVPHSYRVESDLARWLVVNTPPGFEQFVLGASESAPAAELPPAGRPADPAALAQAAAEYGIEILGPPGTLP